MTWTMPKIEHMIPTKYGWIVSHPEKLSLGENTDIGFGTFIQAENGIKINDNTQISSHCSIYSANTIDNTNGTIFIGKNVCIGAGTIILPRSDNKALVIVDNVKIGALSLVKESILKEGTYVGVPAKLLKEKQYESGL